MFSRAFFVSIVTLFLLINASKGLNETANVDVSQKNENCSLSFGDVLQNKIEEYVKLLTHYLEDFNDRHWGKSILGKHIQYEKIKPNESTSLKPSGRMKKMDLAMLPLVFQVGAMSTWMMISAIMSTKSVLIGLALLAFKIAVSSAKMAGFVSKWKNDEHHHEQTSWSSHGPYPEHTSYPSPDSEWRSYFPEWTPNDQDYFPPRQANVDTYRPFSHPIRSYLHADERNTIVDSAMIKRNLIN